MILTRDLSKRGRRRETRIALGAREEDVLMRWSSGSGIRNGSALTFDGGANWICEGEIVVVYGGEFRGMCWLLNQSAKTALL